MLVTLERSCILLQGLQIASLPHYWTLRGLALTLMFHMLCYVVLCLLDLNCIEVLKCCIKQIHRVLSMICFMVRNCLRFQKRSCISFEECNKYHFLTIGLSGVPELILFNWVSLCGHAFTLCSVCCWIWIVLRFQSGASTENPRDFDVLYSEAPNSL